MGERFGSATRKCDVETRSIPAFLILLRGTRAFSRRKGKQTTRWKEAHVDWNEERRDVSLER